MASALGGDAGEGDYLRVRLTIEGVSVEAQRDVNGEFVVNKGELRLPNLKNGIPVTGLSNEELSRKIEKAFKEDGIYRTPVVKAVILREATTCIFIVEKVVTVKGKIQNSGSIKWESGLTLRGVLKAAGSESIKEGDSVYLTRNGKVYQYDPSEESHLKLRVYPKDVIEVKK